MFIQHVLKGISGLTEPEARDILAGGGLRCNWWLRVSEISLPEINGQLTERNLEWHLKHYDDLDPLTGAPFRENTPFISTTAGSVQRSEFLSRNIVYPPFLTALRFATRDFSADGYIFHAYLFTLGKPAVRIQEFAEEVRELHQYTAYLPFHAEGEIVAKIAIPALRIQKCERYLGPQSLADLTSGRPMAPDAVIMNLDYLPPDDLSNVRGFVS